MKQSSILFATLFCLAGIATAQQPKPKTAPSKLAAAAEKTRPKFKAIWEPVNYKEDLPLFDVYFVSKEEGWVTGAANTILHTKDGGNTWTAELGGDPHAQGEELKHAFFKDSKHGWAQAWSTMFRTTDGETWQQVKGEVRGNAVFVSDLRGFYASGGRLDVTLDGGKTWKQIFTCRAKMEANGLTQERDCDLASFDFPTPTVGYAMHEARVTAKTEDGGATWRVLVGPEEPGDQRVNSVFFLDANTGYEVRGDLHLYRTTDGGQTWQGVIAKLAAGNPQVKFAGHEVGWSLYGNTWAYSVDGGKRWTTREVRFPASVTAFCMPTSDRGYAVGDHGMIYRYRVVPIDYTAKGMIEAPMMPAAPEGN
ncbi:MAG: YCF48-related protein [Candidatus Angelobacter sp.]